MLDLHATSCAGATAGLGEIGTIAIGDHATIAGIPLDKCELALWGGLTTIADTIERLQLLCNDALDAINGEDMFPGASSLLGMIMKYTNIPYKTAKRKISIDQNTAAANALGFTIDNYGGGGSRVGKRTQKDVVVLPVTFGALTAITWGQIAVAPANPIPNGKYIILGAWVNALTNYALLRFNHANFGGKRPGFPVIDITNTAVANAVSAKDPLLLEQGYQFVALCEKLGVPCCPEFNVSNAGTGLIIEAIAITADTPKVLLNLARVGD